MPRVWTVRVYVELHVEGRDPAEAEERALSKLRARVLGGPLSLWGWRAAAFGGWDGPADDAETPAPG